jgi:hypothetical protein
MGLRGCYHAHTKNIHKKNEITAPAAIGSTARFGPLPQSAAE